MTFNWYRPHPYGVLPEGNSYYQPNPSHNISEELIAAASSSLGSTASSRKMKQLLERQQKEAELNRRISFAHPTAPLFKLPTNLITEIVSFLTPKPLSLLSQVNWHWNAVSNFPEVWKTLFILAATSSSEEENSDEGVVTVDKDWKNLVANLGLLNNNHRNVRSPLLHFEHNWKTFLIRLSMFENLDEINTKAKGSLFVHRPFGPSNPKKSALCSDPHFQSWLCSILPPDFKGKFKETQFYGFGKIMEKNCVATKIDEKTGQALEYSYSPDEFRREFEEPNLPVVLKGAAKHWELYKILNGEFANLGKKADEILRENKQNERFRCESVLLSLNEYASYAQNQATDERPIYMFDAHFQKEGFKPNLWEVPTHFGRDDLFAALGEKNRPLYRWLIAGPKRSGSSFHVDPNYTSAWNANLTGKKRWLMFPPGLCPPGIHFSEDMTQVTAPASITEWFFSFYDATLDKFRGQGIECTVDAGDIIFVPAGWVHAVINLEDSVAITQNFVSQCNLKSVLRFLRCLKTAISGIGEESDDSEQQQQQQLNQDSSTSASTTTANNDNRSHASGPSRPGQQQQGFGNSSASAVEKKKKNNNAAGGSSSSMMMSSCPCDDPALEEKRNNFLRIFSEAVVKYRPDLIHLVKEEDDEAQKKKQAANERRRQREEVAAAFNLNKNTKNEDSSKSSNNNSGESCSNSDDNNSGTGGGGGGFSFGFSF